MDRARQGDNDKTRRRDQGLSHRTHISEKRKPPLPPVRPEHGRRGFGFLFRPCRLRRGRRLGAGFGQLLGVRGSLEIEVAADFVHERARDRVFLGREAANQRVVADDVDRPRHALGRVVDGEDRFTSEDLRGLTARDPEPAGDVRAGLLERE